MGNIQTQNPEQVLTAIGEVLDKLGFSYERDGNVFATTVVGKDIPMRFRIGVSEKKQTMIVYSTLPIEIDLQKIELITFAISAVNYKLLNGCFELDEKDRTIYFRMTASYRDSEISEELLKYMIRCSIQTVDEYNDKLLLFCRGILTLEDYEKEIGFN